MTTPASPVTGVRRQRSPSPEVHRLQSQLSPSRPPNKKGRLDDEDAVQPLSLLQLSGLRTALDLQKAIENIHDGDKLGHCVSKIRIVHNRADDYRWYTAEIEEKGELNKRARKGEASNEKIIQELVPIYERLCVPFAKGVLDQPFRLRITRAGCPFDGELDQRETHTRLQHWFDNAALSGYGDVLAQETKFDEDVRKAREIPASEFSVEPALLEWIQSCWSKSFHPPGVRVEPYKIHLYGPGGHFKAHRDTPQINLVGTFLLGVGDTTHQKNLVVNGNEVSAKEGEWCAFYPDVVHSVKKVNFGHRAVIAFKIFRTTENQDGAGTVPPEYRIPVAQVLNKLQLPIGIFLDRQYCIGTTQLSGFDAFLLQCAKDRAASEGFVVHVLPVVTKGDSVWWTNDSKCKDRLEADVYAFTDAHIECILGRGDEEVWKRRDVFKDVKKVPFFSMDFKQSTVIWKEAVDEYENHTGNEADVYREDSLYFSYALLMLPLGLGNPEGIAEDSEGSSGTASEGADGTAEGSLDENA
ncbi:hypothetical protein JAAARDRAFT_180355 [Jaapia argillacea MUCL 33604]|uniref:Prolyl 4-hydroxylase alpha subunit Fe(2+) 2OG dioxygenase domain-containing protein n=1 Tax=Jaapia argillacea MUCL 33604 TaxID=933084 RepID=A0A067PKY6_9AGAM|nr:hypothetical protein JAAARDRAFT_180355 [Jaapia argillacea MUCL 33604]